MFRKRIDSPSPAVEISSPASPSETIERDPFDQYVRSAPTAQNALDLFEGSWQSALPTVLGLKAGTLPTFDDRRIKAVLHHLDSIKTYKVLELGPLEAGHTYMLHEAGSRVVAVESSTKAFLKCLVVKEILNLNRAHFLLGDFVPYLERTKEKYDLVVASGVLYHSMDPIQLLELISKVSNKVAIWTHYWDEEAIAADDDMAAKFSSPPVDTEWRGRSLRLHPRLDPTADECRNFSGGPERDAVWLERDGLMTVLTQLGFETITVLDEEGDHVNGPAILLCAER